jgi:hypothetical protein
MTKEELQAETLKIEQQFGKAEWDNYAPGNESARKIQELRKAFHVERAGSRPNARKPLKAISDGLDKHQVKQLLSQPIPELFLSKQDLSYFTDLESKILVDKFSNYNQSDKELALKHNTSYQFVTALLASPAYKLLYTKKYYEILPIESLIALRMAMKAGDVKAALELARHFKLIQNEQSDVNINSKTIDDPLAVKMLKELGDSLATKKGEGV